MQLDKLHWVLESISWWLHAVKLSMHIFT